MNKKEIQALIDSTLRGQGTQTDAGGSLPLILTEILNMAASGGGGGTSYEAGDGIDITDDVISVDDTVAKAGPVNLALQGKQEKLVSGENIKTVNGQSLLGDGNIETPTGTVDQSFTPSSANAQSGKAVAQAISGKQNTLVSGESIKTVGGQSLLGSGNIPLPTGSAVELLYTISTFDDAVAAVDSGNAIVIDDGTEKHVAVSYAKGSDIVTFLTLAQSGQIGASVFFAIAKDGNGWTRVASNLQEQINVPDFSTLNDSAQIEQTKNNNLHRLSFGLEDNTDKISIAIWNGSNEKRWYAETEQSLRRQVLAGLTPDYTQENGTILVIMGDFNPLPLDYVVMDSNESYVGKRITDVSPFVYQRLGTEDVLVTLTAVENNPGEWEVSAYDGSVYPKMWNFYAKNPLVPRVQTWLELPKERIVVGEERLIGEWVEGGVAYDLYEKVVFFGELPNSATKTMEHGIVDRVRFTKVYGSAYGKTVSGNNFFLPFVNADATKNIYIAAGNRSITITTNADRTNMEAYVYLEFIRERA